MMCMEKSLTLNTDLNLNGPLIWS